MILFDEFIERDHVSQLTANWYSIYFPFPFVTWAYFIDRERA